MGNDETDRNGAPHEPDGLPAGEAETDATPDADQRDSGPSGPQIDIRRLIVTVAIIVLGLGYFFWDQVRDVVSPPTIAPRSAPVDPQMDADVVRVEHGQFDVTFTPLGAAIKELKWVSPEDGHTETLIAPTYESTGETHHNRGLLVTLPDSEEWAEQPYELVGDSVETIDVEGEPVEVRGLSFRRESDGIALTKTFVVRGDKPLIILSVDIENVGASLAVDAWEALSEAGAYTLTVSNAVGVPADLGRGDCQVAVRADNIVRHHEVRRLSGVRRWPGDEERKSAVPGPGEGTPTLQWVSNATQYFAVIVIPETPLYDGRMELTRTASAGAAVDIQVPLPGPGLIGRDRVTQRFHIYAGPKDYDTLARLPGRPQEAVDYWYFGPAAIRLLTWIYDNVVPNYGVAIILFTIVLRLLMWPVTSYNLRAMVDMKIANARLEDIDAREPPRSEVQAHATWLKEARVWEKVQGRATIGVILPLAILLPVLLILYHTLRVGYVFHREPFLLWINDITRRDPAFILPILMGLGMMGQLRAMSENPQKERMWIFMPIAFTALFAFFSAGLVLFWLTLMWVGWAQLALIRRSGKAGAAHPNIQKAEQRAAEIREGADNDGDEPGDEDEGEDNAPDRPSDDDNQPDADK